MLYLLIPWYILGFCWTGCFQQNTAATSNRWWQLKGALASTALSIALGIPAALLLTQDLAFLGIFRLHIYLGISLAVSWLGLTVAKPHWPHFLPGLGMVAACILLTAAIPDRMQWVAGGWDPGTYVCEGAELARTGSIRRAPERLLQFAGTNAVDTLSRNKPEHHFTEFMPVVPPNRDRLSTAPFFFPLTPALFANTFATAGPEYATKANLLLGLLAALLFAALLARQFPKQRLVPLIAGASLLLHPLWVFHMNFTTSEILQCTLILALALFLQQHGKTTKTPEAPRIAIALILFAAVLNRIDFFFFGAGFVLLYTLLPRAWNGSVSRREIRNDLLLFSAALLIGFGYDLWFAPHAVQRIGGDVTILGVAGGLLIAAAWASHFLYPTLTANDKINKANLILRHLTPWLVAAGSILLIAALLYLESNKPVRELRWQFQGLPYFLTWPTLCLAALGFFAIEFHKPKPTFGLWLLFLAAIAIVMLVFVKIHPSWPWAARRHVFSTLPLLIAVGCWAAFSINRRIPMLGSFLLILVIALNLPRSQTAWATTADDTNLIQRLSDVAEAVPDQTLLICDHFIWSVPLRFLFGQQTYNGEALWNEHEDASIVDARLDILRDYPGRIAFLTSDKNGIERYPESIQAELNIVTNFPAFNYRKVKRAQFIGGFTEAERKKYRDVLNHFVAGYEQQENPKQFRLYTWDRPRDPNPKTTPGLVTINIGDESADDNLGRGWSGQREGSRNQTGRWNDFVWMTSVEADLTVDIHSKGDHHFILRAHPFDFPDLRQSIGLFINGRFIDDWICEPTFKQESFYTRVPAKALKQGENKITLRAGQLKGTKIPSNDSRKFALLADKIHLWPSE